MNNTTSEFGPQKPNLRKLNQKLFKNILSQREEQQIKHLLSNKSHTNFPPKTNRQLNPIQLKKTYRPSQRTAIDCETSSVNTNNTNKPTIKNEYKEVYDFLKDLKMEMYFDTFIKNGINTEEKILYLNNDNLKLIDIPYAHRARFLKKLKEIETMQIMKKNINEKGGLSKLKLKKNETKYEEIILPKEEDDIEIKDDEQRDAFTKAIFDYQKSHSKFEENNDNFINNNELFHTGINNMKITHKSKMINRYSENNGNIQQTKEISIGTSNNDNNNTKDLSQNKIINNDIDNNNIQIKKSIGIGEEPINTNKNNNSITNVEKGEYIEKENIKTKSYENSSIIDISPKQFFPLYKQKTLCYNCLHMILEDQCIKKYDKPFCSLQCLEIFERKSVTNCNCCEKIIEIGYSIPSTLKEKTYYCSTECLQKKEPNENNIINKSQIMDKNISPNSSETSENAVDILDI